MSYKLYTQNNYFFIVDTSNDVVYEASSKSVLIKRVSTNSEIFTISGVDDFNEYKQINLNEIVDVNDNPFASYEDFQTWYTNYTGNFSLGATQPPTYFVIEKLEDFPRPVSNAIKLLEDACYFIIATIDLKGNRLIGSSNTCLLGTSSENSFLTSTGLGVGIPLFSSNYTTPIRHITFFDVHTAIYFDGTSNLVALDWTGVNFSNVPNIGTVNTVSNFIFDKGAFLSSKGLKFDGTIGTLALNNSLFSGDGNLGDIIKLEPTCIIQRRFRIIYSSVIAFGSTKGINVSTSATIPNQAYILDTVNFSGGGTYLEGILDTMNDNRKLFKSCEGIINTAEVSQYTMNGNALVTTITNIGTPVKIEGLTLSGSITQKFVNTNNRATYVGSKKQFFKVSIVSSLESTNNNKLGLYVAKNGVHIDSSVSYGTANGSGRSENLIAQVSLELEENDYIEAFTSNESQTNPIVATDLNTLIDSI